MSVCWIGHLRAGLPRPGHGATCADFVRERTKERIFVAQLYLLLSRALSPARWHRQDPHPGGRETYFQWLTPTLAPLICGRREKKR